MKYYPLLRGVKDRLEEIHKFCEDRGLEPIFILDSCDQKENLARRIIDGDPKKVSYNEVTSVLNNLRKKYPFKN